MLMAGDWRWAVVGGVALAACGHPRLTLDLEIVTESGAQDTLVPSLGAAGNDYFLLLLADGSVRNVKKNIPPAILHSLIQIDDGQAINWDGF